MKQGQKLRIGIDMAMVILMPLLMAYSLVGEAVHEWMGLVMFLLFIVHHAINWRWHKNLIKGHCSAVRIWGIVINGLLAIIMIALPVSGIIMARHTVQFLKFSSGMALPRNVHLLTSYWGFVLMSLHLGLHWNMVLGVVRKSVHIKKPSIYHIIILRVIAMLFCFYGIYAFVDLQFGAYMLLQNQFVFF